jgi:hypothetical protein
VVEARPPEEVGEHGGAPDGGHAIRELEDLRRDARHLCHDDHGGAGALPEDVARLAAVRERGVLVGREELGDRHGEGP